MKYLNLIGTSILSLSLVACGGGGSDSGSDGGQGTSAMQQYNGKTSYAALDAGLCSYVKEDLFGDNGYLMLAKNFSTDALIPGDIGENATEAGEFGGLITIQTNFNSANIGTARSIFDNYSPFENFTVNGQIGFEQDEYLSYEQYHMVISFVDLNTIYGTQMDMSVSGTMDIDRMHQESYVESVTLNMNYTFNNSGYQIAAEDFVVTSYDNNELEISGSILDSGLGRVDVYNDGVVTFRGDYFTGASIIAVGGDSKCRFSYVSSEQVTVEVDSDNDDVYETSNIETWY